MSKPSGCPRLRRNVRSMITYLFGLSCPVRHLFPASSVIYVALIIGLFASSFSLGTLLGMLHAGTVEAQMICSSCKYPTDAQSDQFATIIVQLCWRHSVVDEWITPAIRDMHVLSDFTQNKVHLRPGSDSVLLILKLSVHGVIRLGSKHGGPPCGNGHSYSRIRNQAF